MKYKILNLSIILASLFGYLEWSGNNKSFLLQAEIEVITTLFTKPILAIHPFTIFPLIGQMLLLLTLFQKKPSKKLTFASIALIGLLLWFMLVIGFISMNYKIMLSTLPFTLLTIIAIKNYRKVELTKI